MRGRDNRRKDVKIKMNGERNLRRWLCHPCILTFLLLLRPSSPYSPHTSMLLSSSSSEYFCTREVLRFQFTALLSQLLSFSFHHHYTPVLLCSPTSPCQSPTALRPLQSSLPALLLSHTCPAVSPLKNQYVLLWFKQASLTRSHLSPHSNLVVSSLPLTFYLSLCFISDLKTSNEAL